MKNDSIETLMLRHYGSLAPTPPELKQQLIASVRWKAVQYNQQERTATALRTSLVSRRRAVRLVAISSVGLGLLSIGLEGLHMLEAALVGKDITQPAIS
jgi:hypothetical protein